MDDQNTNQPSNDSIPPSDTITEDTSAAENTAQNNDVIASKASQSKLNESQNQDSDVANAPQNDNTNPFAALKESDIEAKEATESEATPVDAVETSEESEKTETIEAIGNEETKVEDAKSASSEPEYTQNDSETGTSETEAAGESESASSDNSDQSDESGIPSPSESSEEQEEPKPSVPTNPNARWYVVHTFAGHENKVATALRQRIEAERLENLIFDILVPTQDKIEIKGGKKETVKEKIFPGYILIKMELSDLSWLAVRTTQGVTSFIGAGNKPTPISEAEVASIVRFTTQGAQPTFKDVFMVDDTVKIIDGPFAEFIGKVDSVDKEKGRVRVLVSIFGRETPVELDFLQVQKL